MFSKIDDKLKWNGVDKISDDHVKLVWEYLLEDYMLEHFSAYMRSLYSDNVRTLAWDSQHPLAAKAKTVVALNKRISIMKSISAIVDSNNYIASICMTVTHSNDEIKQQMEGLARRYNCSPMSRKDERGEVLRGAELVEVFGSDYVEKYSPMVLTIFRKARAFQDVFHWQQLLFDAILNGVKNPLHSQVRGKIAQAYKKSVSKEDLVTLMEGVYDYYANAGNVWNAAARDIFDRQLERVRKGYLESGQYSADTSRVENVFKYLNRIQNSFSCGLQTFVGLLLASVDQTNRNNALRLHDPFAMAVYGYQDFVWADGIQGIEAQCFPTEIIPRMNSPMESGGQFGICHYRPERFSVNGLEEQSLQRADQEDLDYQAIFNVNDWVREQRLIEEGINLDHLIVGINQPAAATTTVLPLVNTPPPIPILQNTPTPSENYLRTRAQINADIYHIDGDEHFLFMNLRKLHKWYSWKTRWVEASRIWNGIIRVMNRQRAEILGRFNERDAIILQKKCIDIEVNLPRYLERWRTMKANGQLQVVIEDETIDVQKKINYWESQQLDLPTSKSLICRRCGIDKKPAEINLAGESWRVSHPERVCSDQAPVKLGNKAPFPMPDGLFLGPDGCLDLVRFNELVLVSRTRHMSDDALLSNFALFAIHMLNNDDQLDYHKLEVLGVKVMDNGSILAQQTWLANRSNKKQKLR